MIPFVISARTDEDTRGHSVRPFVRRIPNGGENHPEPTKAGTRSSEE